MFYVKNPCTLNQPWILSKPGSENPVVIPVEVTKLLKNYQIIAIEFLYRNYRKGMKGSILNQEPGMNFQLQISAFFRALIGGPALILVICDRQRGCFWYYHLTNHANFEVIQVTTKNSGDSYKGNTKKIALLVYLDCLKLCENLTDDFLSIVIEDFEQIATKRVIKRLNGSFNVGLTYRSFYTDPDQKLQWTMLNWATPGCVGKLNDFYEIDNQNFALFNDNYRTWWLRLTWKFCESFEKPTADEVDSYEQEVATWASQNSLSFPSRESKKNRKRKIVKKSIITDDVISDSCSSISFPAKKPIADDSDSSEATVKVPSDKYVKLPSMDENPILTSIIKNFEISPEPILTRHSQQSLPYTQTRPTCSSYDENSVVLSFLRDEEKPSTSRSESEDFILNLI